MCPAEITANLERHWNESARTGRRQRGKNWYPAAREWAETLARETAHTVEQVVAVLAITSPAVQLVTNMDHTERILRGGGDSGGRFPNANRPKIAAVLACPEAAAEYVRGPKVGPFHRAILGDRSALVLDRWAIYAATGERDNTNLNKVAGTKRRDAVEHAYRALARKVGVAASELQAIIWLQVRETTPNGRYGVIHKLRDITA
jgi:hypothetical protein